MALSPPSSFPLDSFFAMEDEKVSSPAPQAEGARDGPQAAPARWCSRRRASSPGLGSDARAIHDFLARLGAIPVQAQVVADGKFMTGGGVTAGIDMA